MNLYGDFTESNHSCGLLVHQTGGYQGHHFSLASAETTETATQIVCLPVVLTPLAIAVEANLNCIQKFLLAKRLGKELNRSSSHCLHLHRDVAMTRNQDGS